MQDDGKSEIQRVLLRTTSSNGISRYFGRANDLYSRLPTCKGVQELSQSAMEELRKLMNEIKYEYVASKVMDEDFRSLMSNFFIRINVRHRRLSSDMDDDNIIVKLNRQGDCNLKIGQHESWIRTSPIVYQEIVEIAKKSQFKTSIAWNVRNYRDHRMAESFELALKDNNECKSNNFNFFLFWKFRYKTRQRTRSHLFCYNRVLYSRIQDQKKRRLNSC